MQQVQTIEFETKGGVPLVVRPARSADAFALDRFFDRLTPEDMRFRFLSTVRHIGHRLIEQMTSEDTSLSETFLAFDGHDSELLAVSMLSIAEGGCGEVAIAVRSDLKGKGIGWALLRHAEGRATARGLTTVEAIESRDNAAAIGVEHEQGYRSEPVPESPGLVRLVKDLAA